MRILVVEDEKHLNRIISEAVGDEGYSVDSCFNGKEALEFMECAKYDVMILDIMMPKLNGLDLVRRLRRDGGDAAVYAPDGCGGFGYRGRLGRPS